MANGNTEQIRCYCSGCDLYLYTCANAWAQISNTYYTCARPETQHTHGLVQRGQSRAGHKESELEGCVVQPLLCEKCGLGLGLRCIKSPTAKIDYNNRFFIKLSKIIIRSPATGNNVEPYMEKPLASRVGAKASTSPVANSFTTSRISTSTATGNTSGDMTPAVTTLELQQQKMDIDLLMTKFEGFQKDMDSMITAIDQIKKTTQKSTRQSSSHIFAEELELLTENVSQVGRKANEIDGLKLELEMMKRRIKRLEEVDAATQSTYTVTGLTPSSAVAPRTGKKNGPLARRSKIPDENTLSGQVLPPSVSAQVVKPSVEGTKKSPQRGTDADREVIRDSIDQAPTLSGEKPARYIDPHMDAQNILHDAQSLLNQVQDAAGLPRKPPQPSRRASADEALASPVANIENLGPGQTQDGSYQPSQDISMDMDMDDSVDITQITDSAIGSCIEAPGRPGDIRRSTMTKLPLSSLPPLTTNQNLPTTSPSSSTDTDSMDEASFRPSAPLISEESQTLQTPSDTEFTPNPHPTRSSRGPRSRGGRPRKSEPARPTTPDWERPNWDGPPASTSPYYAYGDNLRGKATSTRGRKVVRRGVSGGGGVGDAGGERAAKRIKGDGEGDAGNGVGVAGSDGRIRDSDGFLLLPNGKRDGRSMRGRKSLGKGGAVAAAAATGTGRGSATGSGSASADAHEKLMRQIFPGREKDAPAT